MPRHMERKRGSAAAAAGIEEAGIAACVIIPGLRGLLAEFRVMRLDIDDGLIAKADTGDGDRRRT